MGKRTSLAPRQLRALDRLRRVRALDGFYLAGGTAIAFHLGHRRSRDLDLFSEDGSADLSRVRVALAAMSPPAKVIAETDVVLQLRFDGEPLDVVRYAYPPLEPPLRGPSGFHVAGLRDLAAMKLGAVARRGVRRDFWDVFSIATTSVPLVEAARAYLERFGLEHSDLYHVARALTYFDDAERERALPAGLTHEAWETIKAFFRAETPKLLVAPQPRSKRAVRTRRQRSR